MKPTTYTADPARMPGYKFICKISVWATRYHLYLLVVIDRGIWGRLLPSLLAAVAVYEGVTGWPAGGGIQGGMSESLLAAAVVYEGVAGWPAGSIWGWTASKPAGGDVRIYEGVAGWPAGSSSGIEGGLPASLLAAVAV